MPANVTFKELLDTYLSVTDTLHHGVMWLDGNGNILGVNSSFANALGYDQSAFHRKTIFQISPRTNFLEWKTLWDELLVKRRVKLQAEHVTSTGALSPLQLEGLLFELAGEPVCFTIVENLMQSERYLDLLVLTESISRTGSWEWDLLHREVVVSAGLSYLMGIVPQKTFSPKEAADFLATSLFPEGLAELNEKLEQAVKKGDPFELELPLRPNGTDRPLYLSLAARPMQQGGRTHKVCGILRDLSNVAARTDELYLTQYCVNNASQMMYWLDTDGNFNYANKAFCRKLGYSQSEIVGMNLSAVEPGLNQQRWEQRWEDLKETGQLQLLTTCQTKNGEEFPVKVIANCVNYNGREYSLAFTSPQGSADDPEILQLAIQSLRQGEEMVFWLTADGRFYYFNDIFCRKLGCQREDLGRKRLKDVAPGLTAAEFKQIWERIKRGEILQVEWDMAHYQGHTIPVEATITLVEVDDREYSCITMRDITARKRREEQLRLAFETIQQSPEMIFWLNPDGSFRLFNEKFLEVTGYRREEVVHKRVTDFFPHFFDESFGKGWERLRTEGTMGSEMEIIGKDGSKTPVESKVSLVKVDGNEYSSTTLRDITERKANEAERARQFAEISRLRQELEAENIQLKEDIQVEQGTGNIISRSPKYKPVLRQIAQVADTSATVLVLGETGTGKELVAKAIHQLSERSNRSMVKVNCSALPANLIESELFGHEKGSFTGAFQRKIGRFELAHQGTLFLDEIGELPLELQGKLLRILQEGEFERVGGNETISVDVRIIAATNRKLEEQVRAGKFREDLYYRLNVFPIYSIPLRERTDDIPPLVKHFVEKYNKRLGKQVSEVPQSVLSDLMKYQFPGNVRELENLIERAVILSRGKRLMIDFNFQGATTRSKQKNFPTMEALQCEHILKALRRTNGKITGTGGAAELLGMNDKTLYSRMTKLGIGKNDFLK